MSDRPTPRRPSSLRWELPNPQWGAGDPAMLMEAAYRTSAALIRHGRQNPPDDVAALVALTDELGMDEVAEMWSSCPGDSLPGALWRLYLVRADIRTHPEAVALAYRTGQPLAHVDSVVAGASDPPGPAQMVELADAILTGAFSGDLVVALERAAAYCRIVSVGLASMLPEEIDPTSVAQHNLRRSGAMSALATELASAASACAQGHWSELSDDED